MTVIDRENGRGGLFSETKELEAKYLRNVAPRRAECYSDNILFPTPLRYCKSPLPASSCPLHKKST